MKKIILSSIAGIAALVLVGCGSSSQDNAIKNLSSQLDRVTNTVGSMTTSQYATLAPTSYNVNDYTKSNNQYGYVGSQISKMQASAYEQESLQDLLLTKSATLKAELNQKLKLNKEQIKALNGLTNSISKYATNLNSTKSDINNSVKMIRKNSCNNCQNEQIGAYYQSLNNHLDARLCYFRNLLNTMDQIENIIGCPNCNKTQNQNETNNVIQENTNQTPIVDNQPIVNNVNGYNNGYNNGYYNNGYYNNGYNYNRTFNPSRNTDTYRPGIRNIDTYRANPNQNPVGNGYNYRYNANNIPVNNIQTQEEINQKDMKKEDAIKNGVITKTVEEKQKFISKLQKDDTTNKLQTKQQDFPDEVSKTQEVRNYKNLTDRLNKLEIDHTQTNKKIEKLIRG